MILGEILEVFQKWDSNAQWVLVKDLNDKFRFCSLRSYKIFSNMETMKDILRSIVSTLRDKEPATSRTLIAQPDECAKLLEALYTVLVVSSDEEGEKE